MTALSRAARTVSRPGLIRRIVAGTLGAAVATVALPLMSAPSAHALTGVGATAAFGPGNTLIPQWYSDATGLKLQPCNAGLPKCPFSPADFVAPNGEAFYYLAQTSLVTAAHPGPAGAAAPASRLVMGVEAAFVGDGVPPHGVTGSPAGNNFFRVEGPGINPNPADAATACPGLRAGPDCVQTTLFLMSAQLAPSIAAVPTTATFASQLTGTSSPAQNVTVTNTGGSPVTVGTVSTTGANAADFLLAAAA